MRMIWRIALAVPVVAVSAASAVAAAPGGPERLASRPHASTGRPPIANARGAHPAKRRPTRQLRYRLSVLFTQDYRYSATGSNPTMYRIQTSTAAQGDDSGFSLVQSGRQSAPQYAIANRSGYLTFDSELTFKGGEVWANRQPFVDCEIPDGSLSLKAPAPAYMKVRLIHNQFQVLKIRSEAAVNRHDVMTCTTPDGYQTTLTQDQLWTLGPVSSPSDDHGVTRGPIHISAHKVAFGHSFTLKFHQGPENDPDLHVHSAGGGTVIDETWSYTWRLDFTPVEAP